MPLHGQFVVGVYLHREVLSRVDELYQQRELVAELFVDLLAYEQALVLVDELGKVQAHIHIVNKATFHSDALMAGYATDFPTFTDIGLGCIDTFEGGYLVAPPNGRL